MVDCVALSERMERLADVAAGSPDRGATLRDMERALCDGYASALAAEAELMRLEARLDAVLRSGDAGRAAAYGELVHAHRSTERCVSRLRSALTRAHDVFVSLGGGRLASRD